MRIKLLSIAAIVGLLVLAIVHFAFNSKPSAPESTFYLTDGSTLTSADMRKQVLVVNFWATSCTTCVAEMPHMASLYQRYKGQGLQFIAVAMAYDPQAYVIRFQASQQLPFPVALDSSGALAKNWGEIALTPTTFLVDKSGTIVKKYVGQPDFDEFSQAIEKLL